MFIWMETCRAKQRHHDDRRLSVCVARSMVALVLGGIMQTTLAEITYIHTDAFGNVVAETDQNGNVIARYYYEPYGLPDEPIEDQPGYTGHLHDSDTGLIYMQQRYYDPVIAQFLSVDPVAANGSDGSNFNRYWYANNNPYSYMDPDGRFATAFVANPTFIVRAAQIASGQADISGGIYVLVHGVTFSVGGGLGFTVHGFDAASITASGNFGIGPGLYAGVGFTGGISLREGPAPDTGLSTITTNHIEINGSALGVGVGMSMDFPILEDGDLAVTSGNLLPSKLGKAGAAVGQQASAGIQTTSSATINWTGDDSSSSNDGVALREIRTYRVEGRLDSKRLRDREDLGNQ